MRQALTRTSQVLVDVAVLALAYFAAFVLRFEGWPSYVEFKLDVEFKRLILTTPYIVALQYGILLAAGVPRFAWRYVGLREMQRIALALGINAAALFGVRLGASQVQSAYPFIRWVHVPGGVILIDFALALLGVASVRVLSRILAERSGTSHRAPRKVSEQPTLLIGAGQAGVAVARELGKHAELGIRPVGFLDDDPGKVGTEIHGIRVLGHTTRLTELARRTGATQALIAIAHASGKDIRRIRQLCVDAGLVVKIVPAMSDILTGTVSLSRVRDVSIDDLLGREPVHLDSELIERFIRGKRVLITGAGGSIGSELCRQVARFSPAAIILVERSEFHLFSIHSELSAISDLKTIPRLADVCDADRVEAVFAQHKPHVVFHAAAHKHVPMMEWNPGEAVKNNVFGTKEIADAADRHGVGHFVLISTDKAVNPSSVMGATKRVAEMYIQALSQRSKTKYAAVRFGNVLGSAGSVIPTFKAQIAKGGPVTVTHPDMQRYFMTIPEASQLVMQAAAMGNGAEIFVLDMGEPVRIVDLARDLIRLSGLEADEDIKIEFAGIRPGEKLFEELGFDAEQMRRTRHPKIFEGTMTPSTWERATQNMALLSRMRGSESVAEIRHVLRAVVPEMLVALDAKQPKIATTSEPVEHSGAAAVGALG